jgi:hypothetical protein
MLQSALGKKLHPDADSKKRLSFFEHGLVQRGHHSRYRIETALAVGKGAHPRKHDPLGAAHIVGIVRHENFRIGAAFARRALERLRRGMQIARAVIDHSDGHRCPGVGNMPITFRSADATASFVSG